MRVRLKAFCNIARYKKVLLLTDLDKKPCARDLITDWYGQARIAQPPDQLMFRVAVHEIESWILADDQALKSYMGIGNKAKGVKNPDSILDPKKELLKLASDASRDIKADMLPQSGAIASVGIGYNARMCAFVSKVWDPRRASQKSDSLRRACNRLKQWAAQDSGHSAQRTGGE